MNNSQALPQQQSIFTIALVSYLLFRTLYGSQLRFEEILPKFILMFFYAVSTVCSALCILQTRQSLIQKIELLFLGCLTSYFFVCYKYYMIAPILLIFAVKDIPFKKIISIQVKTIGVVMLLLLLLTVMGVLTDLEFKRDITIFGHSFIKNAHALGFVYYSAIPLYCGELIVFCAYLKRKLNLGDLLLFSALSILVFFIALNRLQIIMCMGCIMLMYISQNTWFKSFLHNKLFKLVASIGFPLMSVLSVIMPFMILFSGDSELISSINDNTNGRQGLNVQAFSRYEVTMLGNLIETEDSATEYFYIDSGYINSILAYGIIFTIIILWLYTKTFIKAYDQRDVKMYVILFVTMFIMISNDLFMAINFFPGLLYCYSNQRNKRSQTDIKKYVKLIRLYKRNEIS